MNKNKGEGPNKRFLPPFVQYAEWLQLCCFSAIMFVSGIYIPVIGAITSLLSPVPISLIGIRQGSDKAFLAVVFVATLLFLPLGFAGSMSFVFFSGLLGLIFCGVIKKSNSAGEAIFGLTVAAIIFKLICMGLMVYTIGKNPFKFDENSVNAIVNSLKESGVGESILKTVRQHINLIIPSFLIMASGLDAYINYLFVSRIERRRRKMSNNEGAERNAVEIMLIPPFEQWSFPRSVMTAFFLAFLITLFENYDTSIMLISAELNLKILTFVIFFIQGTCFTWWWTLHKNFPYGIRLSIIFVLLFIPIFSLGLIVLGMLDIALNLRQRIRRDNK